MQDKKLFESLAYEIYNWCKEKELWGDNCIYFNGKALASWSEWSGVHGVKIYDDLYEYENKNPLDYFEYAHPDTLSMSFEGDLYYVLNGYTSGCYQLWDEFEKLFEKYDLYYELGNAWNLSACKRY